MAGCDNDLVGRCDTTPSRPTSSAGGQTDESPPGCEGDVRRLDIPGVGTLQLAHLVLDLNGTLSDRGRLIVGVSERLRTLGRDLEVHIVSADTYGTAAELAAALGTPLTTIGEGGQKAAFVQQLGADATVAIGNGRNDALMLRLARLGIAVIGPEGGAATAALLAADVVCRSVQEALDLVLDERAVAATLRR
jgi:soluble P-type ATPase